jgi:protein-S-isoprenylcysteine O-methyltransferase Ste14
MKYLLVRLVAFLIFGGVAAGVMFGLAGRSDLWNVWAYVGILVVLLCLNALALYRKDPDLLKERSKQAAPGRVRWTASDAAVVVSILQWVIAGLDQRFHWSDVVPTYGVVAGLGIFAVGWGLGVWVRTVNPFYSPAVRIQRERGQRVISEGPYAVARHPGYLGYLSTAVANPLALNSLLAFIPAVIVVATTLRVIAIEERMLRDELAGYADYAARVRYRLVPCLW